MDTASQINLFQSPVLLYDIRGSGMVEIRGVSTDPIKTNQIGTHPHFGDCFICPHTPTNIVSLHLLKRLYSVSYDSTRGDTFYCSNADHTLEFNAHESGFWVYKGVNKVKKKPPDLNAIAIPVMVGKSGKMYSAVEVARAKEYQHFHMCRAHISDQVAKSIFDMNVYADCPLTSKDVDNYRDIYGPCPYCQIGKATNPGSKESTGIPPSDLGTHLHVDLVTFFGFGPFCLASEDRINYLMCTLLSRKTAFNVLLALRGFVSHLHKHNFTVSRISTDHENAFGACVDPLAALSPPIKLDQTPAGRHEKKLERQVRTIKNLMRAVCASLPYVLPPQCMEELLYLIIQSRNDAVNAISGQQTPRQAIEGKKPSYKLTCSTVFGTLIAVPCPHQLDKQPRAIECLYLRTLPNGDHRVFNIKTARIISAGPKFTVLHPSPLLIEALNKLSTDKHKQLYQLMLDSSDPDVAGDSPIDLAVEVPVDSENSVEVSDGLQSDDTPPTDPHADLNVYSPVAAHDSDSATEHEYSNNSSISHQSSELDKGEPSVSVEEADATHTDANSVEVSSPDSGVAVEAAADALPSPTFQSDTPTESATPAAAPDAEPSGRSGLRWPRSDWKTRFSHVVASTPPLTCALASLDVQDSVYCSHVVMQLLCLQAMTVKDAIEEYGQPALDAVFKEINQLVDTNAMEPVHFSSLAPDQRKRILSSMMNMVKKVKANGVFDKFKSRFLAGGHTQDRDLYPDRSSPTCNLTAFFSLASLAALEGRAVATLDIGGAFLHAILDRKEYLRVSKYLSSLIVSAKPEWAQYLHEGQLYLQLNKALYGLVESPLLWYRHLRESLIELGYMCCKYDRCVFYRTLPDGQRVMMCVHVDDLFITAPHRSQLEELIEALRKKFGNVTSEISDTLNYLGMEVTYNRTTRSVAIKQTGYVDQIIKQYDVSHTSTYPYDTHLLDEDYKGASAAPVPVNDYLSLTMKLMYLAKRTRPDLLFVMSYLATKGKEPKVGDMDKLMKVLRYLNGTRDLYLNLCAKDSTVYLYVDASYAIHSDCKGHSGALMSVGDGGPVHAASNKQKITTKSSTESELVSLHEGLGPLEWLLHLLEELGYPTAPAIVYEDNKSTITLAKDGLTSTNRTKHMNVRYFYIKELIDNGKVKLEYLPTSQQLADLLTKPVLGSQFIELRQKLLNLPY